MLRNSDKLLNRISLNKATFLANFSGNFSPKFPNKIFDVEGYLGFEQFISITKTLDFNLIWVFSKLMMLKTTS